MFPQIMNLAQEVDKKAAEEDRVFGQQGPTSSWFRRFKKRQKLSVRTPENKSVARYNAEDGEIRQDLFQKYVKIVDENNLSPQQIFNMDETGFQLVAKGSKVVAKKGSRCVYVRVSGERSETISAASCGNAAGTVIIPPFFIFKGQSLSLTLEGETYPPLTVFANSESGYMTTIVFVEWFKHFLKNLPTIRPILLIFDGHVSHGSLEVLQLAEENKIILLCLPPHTTHLYQPMDVGVYSLLKKAFRDFVAKCMRKKKNKALARKDFGKIVTRAWDAAVSVKNIRSGFKRTGLWPIDRAAAQQLHSEIVTNEEEPANEPVSMDATSTPTDEPRLMSQPSSSLSSSTESFISTTSSTDPDVVSVIKEMLQPSPKKNAVEVKITKRIKFATLVPTYYHNFSN